MDVGDKVLVREEKKNKLKTEFNPERFEIVERKGNTVTIKSKDGKIYKRNLTQVKKFIDSDSEELESNDEESDQNRQEGEANIEVNGWESRPRRDRKVPERYGDYRVHNIIK